MLSPQEFTVGSFGSAKPGSLILPRTKYEATALIGETEGEGAAAVFVSGQFRFQFFQSSGNTHWRGLIIPGVSPTSRIRLWITRFWQFVAG